MKIMIVDDEMMALEDIKNIVQSVRPEAYIDCFNNYISCLEAVKNKQYDVAFLDITMPGKNGLQLAKEIKEINSDTNIVFVTGYSEYAVDAFSINASGYILKPARKEQVENALNNLRVPLKFNEDKLKVQCFGNFEVFSRGEMVVFKRTLSKELFAYLVNLRGVTADTNELCSVLFSDDSPQNKHYLRNIISDLKRTLTQYGAGDVFLLKRNRFWIDISKIDCDFYHYLEYDSAAINSYFGEYMKQYSWAEMTNGFLYFKNRKEE